MEERMGGIGIGKVKWEGSDKWSKNEQEKERAVCI